MLNTAQQITSNKQSLGECLWNYCGVANEKEFGWILLLQAELNCNCSKLPSDLKLTSSVDKLMYGSFSLVLDLINFNRKQCISSAKC